MKYTGLLLAALLLSACARFPVQFTNQHSEVWQVAATTRECTGVGPQNCLLVKRRGQQDWQLFYDQIEDFNYIPGLEYTINVAVTPISNPPADGSDRRYTLLSIIDRRAPLPQSK